MSEIQNALFLFIGILLININIFSIKQGILTYISFFTSKLSFCKLISQNLALYMISVRQTRSLPITSFKFRLTIYPLVVQPYTFFSLGVLKIFPIRVCPCLTNKKACHSSLQQTYLLSFLFILYLPSFLFLLQNILPVLPLLLLLFSILFLSSYISFLSFFHHLNIGICGKYLFVISITCPFYFFIFYTFLPLLS